MRLDLRGLKCPLPALKTGKRLAALSSGETLEVLSDDPLAGIDIPHLCREGGHKLISTGRSEGAHRFLIERG
nr:sulfurtransferase TusA family protein [Aureimonas mangrovi]